MHTNTPFVLGSAVDLTNKAIQNIFKKEADKLEPQFKKYYNFRTTTDLYEKDSSITGLYEAEFTAENAEIAEDAPIQGFDQSYTQQSVDIIVPFSYMVLNFGTLV